jgi:TPR repeat protein
MIALKKSFFEWFIKTLIPMRGSDPRSGDVRKGSISGPVSSDFHFPRFHTCCHLAVNSGHSIIVRGCCLSRLDLVNRFAKSVVFLRFPADRVGRVGSVSTEQPPFLLKRGHSVCLRIRDRSVCSRGLQRSRFAAAQNTADAQWEYGDRLEYGKGVRIDLIEAAKYYKMSAHQNYAPAQFAYGACLEDGKGVRVDLIEAAKYYKMSAHQNYAPAQCAYAACLGDGKGVRIDLTEAAKYYKLAADQNHPRAEWRYGGCLEYGNGVGIDLTEAARYYKLAIDKGFGPAQYNYALCLENGKGVFYGIRTSSVTPPPRCSSSSLSQET